MVLSAERGQHEGQAAEAAGRGGGASLSGHAAPRGRGVWAALRSCFKTEDEAIAAVARNTGTILPCAPKPTTSTAALPSAIAHIRPTPRAPGAHTHRSTARIRPERAYKRPHLVLAARTRCWSTCSGRTAPSTSARRTRTFPEPRTAVRPEGARARERRLHRQRGKHGRLIRGLSKLLGALPPALRQNLDKVAFVLLALPVAKRIADCSGATCGF